MIESEYTILTVADTRYDLIKTAMVSQMLHARKKAPAFREILVYTGQESHFQIDDRLLAEPEIRQPDYYIQANPGQQAGKLLADLASVFTSETPDAVLLHGDSDPALSAALIATRLNIPVIHTSAGERIHRRNNVPEETNRVLIDDLSSLCLTGTVRAAGSLRNEGMAKERVTWTGDPLYDAFLRVSTNINRFPLNTVSGTGVVPDNYHMAVLCHRETVATPEMCLDIFRTLDSSPLQVIFPVTPEINEIVRKTGYQPERNLRFTDPVDYAEYIRLLLSCRYVVTDEDDVLRDAFFARKPGIMLMNHACYSEIVESGWGVETDIDPEKLAGYLGNIELLNAYPEGLFGDGNSAEHIIDAICTFLDNYHGDGAWHGFGTFDKLPKTVSTAFTYANYRSMITDLKTSGYQFKRFDQYREALDSDTPFVMMRHDIDMSLEKALRMAKIEEEMGVSSTYFVMVRNEFYSLLSGKGHSIVAEILKLGHNLGLHFDCAAYPDGYGIPDYNRACGKEVKLLEDWFDVSVGVVSYHRPNSVVLDGNPGLSDPLPHTYLPVFTRNITYFSDSRGIFRNGHPLKSSDFKERKPLHLLIHPIWWNDRPVSNFQTLQEFCYDDFDKLQKSLADNCTVFRVGRLAEGYD